VASSESSYGFCFANKQFDPVYVPVDEAHPQRPEDTYGLTKVVNEVTAAMFHRRDGTQILSFRIGNVLCPEDYPVVEARLNHPKDRQRVLWSYIDCRDLAVACRLGIERNGLGCEPVIIASDYSSSHLLTPDLLRKFYPKVKQKRRLAGHQAMITNARAKKLLGWKLEYGKRKWKPAA